MVSITKTNFRKIIQDKKHLLQLNDAGKIIEMHQPLENQITIPNVENIAFPNGTVIGISSYGSGITKVVAEEGVSILSKHGSSVILEQYGRATLEKRSDNEWYLSGNIHPPLSTLTITWDQIIYSQVANITDVKEWNTFFDTANNATEPFTQVKTYGNTVQLLGAKNLIIQNSFNSDPTLLSIEGDAVIKIEAYVFYRCSRLSKVAFSNCTEIAENAFQSCVALDLVEFPKCGYIGDGAFKACTKLTLASFPICTSIGSESFDYCNALRAANLPLCTHVSDFAFSSCSKLQEVHLPNCTSLGTSSGNSGIFDNTGAIEQLFAPLILKTIFNGNPEGDLAAALANNPALGANGITYV